MVTMVTAPVPVEVMVEPPVGGMAAVTVGVVVTVVDMVAVVVDMGVGVVMVVRRADMEVMMAVMGEEGIEDMAERVVTEMKAMVEEEVVMVAEEGEMVEEIVTGVVDAVVSMVGEAGMMAETEMGTMVEGAGMVTMVEEVVDVIMETVAVEVTVIGMAMIEVAVVMVEVSVVVVTLTSLEVAPVATTKVMMTDPAIVRCLLILFLSVDCLPLPLLKILQSFSALLDASRRTIRRVCRVSGSTRTRLRADRRASAR